MLITGATITPVAFRDPPLRNVHGVHQPYALRAIIQVRTDEGLVGLGETYGDRGVLDALAAVAPRLAGSDPFDLNALERLVAEALAGSAGPATHGLIGAPGHAKTVATVVSAFEVACWDLRGKALGRPVAELLGGRVRDAVPFSGYLFFKHAAHVPDPGYPADGWGEAMDPDGVVAQARRMVDRYGFRSLKLKGGVLPPMAEAEAIEALRAAFPEHPLRLDPNTAWTVPTSLAVARRLAGVVEYLEDPTAGIGGMAEVARRTEVPLATNMCVTQFDHLPPAVAKGAVRIVLSDHHYWGGLRASLRLAAICRTFGLGLSMHSNSHLGISLAAMTQLAAAVPELTYACDTHHPYLTEDVVRPGAFRFTDGSLAVPEGPGLGVELAEDALGELAEQYLRCGFDTRDDITPMRAVDPGWDPVMPRW
ncbi:glucarate dehydratase family protein [Streptomyces profundus]|uniref:glucarate dehydratase family protein n=1 Tax=Streptomyces profundus TaxID=2867410 RepID=UPI001D16F0DC|nr:glucarate dehydratase family protein [Streptomyces sp. MA3_2.13]UED87342.1 glucarate dehydratase family protein [Streptomyces sp. MA3_2.13]